MNLQPTDPQTVREALAILTSAGAPERLVQHAELVAEVAAELVDAITKLGVPLNRPTILVGAALHDAGKIEHPAELTKPGREHEAAGERLLLARHVSPELARFCRTHGLSPAQMPSFEDLVVAAADKLWRGARHREIESALIDAVAKQARVDRWVAFAVLDDCFEQIAGQGEHRLARQRDSVYESIDQKHVQ